MSRPDNRRPPLPPQFGQPPQAPPNYGQPTHDQYGRPIYPQPGQPQQGYPQPPQYGPPQSGQPQFAQQPQYPQPQYGQLQYGQPMPGQPQPGYGYPAAPQPAYDQFGQPVYPQPAFPEPAAPTIDLGWSGPARGTVPSVALKVRKKSYMEAQGILAFIGVMTILFNTFLFLNRENQMDEEINKQIRAQQTMARTRGMEWIVDTRAVADLRAKAIKVVGVIYGGFIGLGLFFLVLALMVPSYPVGATATGLTIYVGANLVIFFFDPATFANPIAVVIKVLITAALVRSIMAAHAYGRELRRLTLSGAR